jgi:putative DNA primase/helicase
MILPDDLMQVDQWVLWRYDTNNGRKTKIPVNAHGMPANVTDPKNWRPYDDVLGMLQRDRQRYAGLGFVFAPHDPFVGIDLDNCLEGGQLKPWARPLVNTFADTYREVSPSGSGIKIFVKGQLPGTGKRKDFGDHAIEIYDRGRFFTVTGRPFNGVPLHLEQHQADLEKLYALIAGASSSNETVPKGETEGKIPRGERHKTLVSLAGNHETARYDRE